MEMTNGLPDVGMVGKAANIDELKEKLKLMCYLASFSTNKKGTDVKKLRRAIARELTMRSDKCVNRDILV